MCQDLALRSHTSVLAPGLSYVDLRFLGQPQTVGTVVARTPGSVALIDPGPSTCLEQLGQGLQAQGLTLGDVTDVLLTHIHLDHAGATGTIVRRHPHIRVRVHERGVEHLTRPAKLIDSATRFFGAANMARFWGEIAPVPEDRLITVRAGERVDVGGRTFEVAYTPGHAVHHVSYFDGSSRIAFVGDTGGVRIGGGYVLPPTPPPDIDLEAWDASVSRIAAWHPASIFLTHFGPVDAVHVHLQTLLSNLRWMADEVRASLSRDGSDEEHSHRFGQVLRRQILGVEGAGRTAAYEPTAPLESLWFGLARYWRKKGA